MKKILELAIFPLSALLLVGCSDGGEVDYYKMVDYAKKNFSTETVL